MEGNAEKKNPPHLLSQLAQEGISSYLGLFRPRLYLPTVLAALRAFSQNGSSLFFPALCFFASTYSKQDLQKAGPFLRRRKKKL